MAIILRRNGGDRALVPFYHPLSLLDRIDAISREMWRPWGQFDFDGSFAPRTDVYEEKGQLVVKTDLPGVDMKDLDVTLEGDRLTIKAEKKDEVKEDATHHTRERYYGQCFRSMTLPYPVKRDEVKATFNDGVLDLRLTKADEVKARKIEVKAQLPQGGEKKSSRRRKKEDI